MYLVCRSNGHRGFLSQIYTVVTRGSTRTVKGLRRVATRWSSRSFLRSLRLTRCAGSSRPAGDRKRLPWDGRRGGRLPRQRSPTRPANPMVAFSSSPDGRWLLFLPTPRGGGGNGRGKRRGTGSETDSGTGSGRPPGTMSRVQRRRGGEVGSESDKAHPAPPASLPKRLPRHPWRHSSQSAGGRLPPPNRIRSCLVPPMAARLAAAR